ncbi:hypothetical protein [Microbacterium nymphoidis]|uniref:hypothetical protein n=1 Tax=Microbacterium nymphoidis TaxID=2898586 RepID=UPI001E5DC732|nr:hypothetical protein [Microbacterium nymphoidis]MCD2497475.1 hypothetical protein [Microbacterium nymphoidis]
MQRFSDYFNLGLTQSSLDFVNIDVREDSPVYIDPHAIRTQQGEWIASCQVSITTYFDSLLDAVRKGDSARVRELIVPLSEPNETHLGESEGKSRGRSLGSEKKARELIAALQRSRAIKSGLLADLEESILFVDGIGVDILSDITTCLIRTELIVYTKNQCEFHGVKTELQISDPTWDVTARAWLPGAEHDLPRGPDGALLLVPRSIVRIKPELDKDKFFRNYIRPFYVDSELRKGVASEFVKLVAAGKPNAHLKVKLGELEGHLGTSKAAIAKHAEVYPEGMENYRANNTEPKVGLDNAQLSERVGDEVPDLNELLDTVRAIQPGRAGATPYHRAVAALLTAVFAASLGNERLETPQHGGLKRIDITYDNVAGDGFFRWLSLNYPSAVIAVECKNYEEDPGNPEVDQIAMRLGPSQGKVGFLVARSIGDRARMDARCRNVSADQHGFVIALDDEDLQQIVNDVQEALDSGRNPREFPLLRTRFGHLIGQR